MTPPLALGFIVMLWNVPGEPYLEGQLPRLMVTECLPVAAQADNVVLPSLPRVYIRDDAGRWILQDDKRLFAAQISYCADQLGMRPEPAEPRLPHQYQR